MANSTRRAPSRQTTSGPISVHKGETVYHRNGVLCPVCGGTDSDPRGQGTRCTGYHNDEWCECDREGEGTDCKFSPNSRTWKHKLKGDCKCGKTHGYEYTTPKPTATKGKRSRPKSTLGPVEKAYFYTDAEFNVVMRVTRHKPKDFRQSQPDGKGGWIWNLKDVKIVPYNLPEIIRSAVDDRWVIVCEGEKDADNLNARNLIATTLPMGSKKPAFLPTLREPLKGRKVVVIADHDEPGRTHGKLVCETLDGEAEKIILIQAADLPMPEGKAMPDGGDVSDYFEAGGTLEALVGFMKAAPEWVPTPPGLKVFGPDIANESEADRLAEEEEAWERERPRVLEEDDDPHRLARRFVEKHFTVGDETTLLNHKGDYYRPAPEATHFEVYADLTGDLVGAIKDEFDQINLEQLRAIKDAVEKEGGQYSKIPKEKLPKVMQVTPSKVKAVEQALRSETLLSSSFDAPCWIGNADNLPDPVNLMAARNGLLDVTTRKLYPHTSRYFNPFPALPYDYDPNAPRPERWEKFLREVWPDDEGVWREIQKWVGYLLTPDTRQQKILLLVGPPRSGKGTIGRLLTALLGKQNVGDPTLELIASHFGLSSLLGKTVAIVGDARFGGRSSDSELLVSRLLGISGEDSFTIDRKYKESITVRLRSRLVIFTNEPPNLRETSSALANRFCPFQMKQSFLGKEDYELENALLAERAGILNWALTGRDMLQADGRFLVPDSCQSLMDVVKEVASPTQAFMDDCCETDEAIIGHLAKDLKDLPTRESIFKAYVVWCGETNHKASSDGVFGRNLRTACPNIEDRRPRLADGSRERRLQGVELNSYGRSLALKFRPARSGEGY